MLCKFIIDFYTILKSSNVGYLIGYITLQIIFVPSYCYFILAKLPKKVLSEQKFDASLGI